MKKERKILCFFLIGGILLYLGGVALWHYFSTVVGFSNRITIPQERLWQIFHALPLVGVLFLVSLQPILEEFAFRFWAINKKYACYVSFAGMTAFSAFMLPNCYWVAIITAVLFFYLFFVLKNRKIQLISVAITSSLLFGLIHTGHEANFAMKIATTMQITGMGLILSFVVLRFHFIWAVVLHILNNLTVLLIPLIFPAAPITFSDTAYRATLTSHTLFSPDDNRNTIQEDTICLNGYLSDIAIDIAHGNTSNHYFALSNNLKKYHLQVYAKAGHTIDKEHLLHSLVEVTHLKIDTVERQAQILYVADSLKLAQTTGTAGMGIASVVNRFRDKCNVFLIVENDYLLHKYFPDMENLWGIKGYEEAKQYLKKYGLAINENDLQTVKQIYFIDN